MVFINPLIEVGIIAFAWFALFQLLRNKFVDKKVQKEAKEKQKEWRELLKSTDKKDQKKAEKVQQEVMDLNFKVMRGTMPMMAVSLGLILTVFPLLHAYYTENFPLDWTVPLPLLEKSPSWIWYFFVVQIALSVSLAVGKRAMKKFGESEGK